MKSAYFSVPLLSLLAPSVFADPVVYVDAAGDYSPANPSNGASVIWKPGSADEVPGLSFGTNAFGTIAEAIANVDAGGTIFIAGGTYLEGAVLNIDKNLTLQGDGADATFLSGGSNGNNGPDAGEHRVLDISSASARVVINDLAIIDGQGNVTGGSSVTNNEGGGIRNLGILTVNRCVIARNVVALGGGIFNSGTLTLNDSELSSNRGSGLANDGTATINRSRFVNNFNFNAGGGIDNFSGSQMTINDSLISENTADRGAGANNGPDASMVLNNTEIRENSATKGAGICNLGGTVTLNRCLIDANTSSDEGGAGIYNEIGFVDTTSRLNVFDSVISGNTANRGNSTAFATGGGILNDQIARIERSEITGNQARYGGGIHNQGSGADLTVLDSNFDGNSATLGGGALRNDKTANVENCAFINNRANGEGGALFNVNYEIPLGGGSFLVFGADLNLTNCTLSNNTADSGGAIQNQSTQSILNLVHCTVVGNNARFAAGIDNIVSGGTSSASGILNLTNSIVAGNINDPRFPSENDIRGTVNQTGTNIIGIPGGSVLGDILAPLADNGGSTQTHALVAGSPAIDTATTIAGVDTDQRRVGRPISTAPDVGAFEFSSAAFPTILSTTPSGTGGFGAGDEIEIVASEALTLGEGDIVPDIQLRRISDGTLIPSSATLVGATITITIDSIDGLPPRSAFNFVFRSDAFYGTTSGLPLLASELNNGRVYYTQTNVAYVDDLAGDYTITVDQGAPGLDIGDTVTWNGTSQGGPVSGLLFGVDAYLSVLDAVEGVVSGGSVFLAGGTYVDALTISIEDKSLTLQGDGADVSIISGNNTRQVINYNVDFSVAPQTLEINDLSIVNGNFFSSGAGIRSIRGSLALNRVNFSGNVADSSTSTVASGGAISIFQADLTIQDSTFANNRSDGSGGAIFLSQAPTVINNSTFSGNSAERTGGAFFLNIGEVELRNCTIINNISSSDAGGIFNNTATLTLNNTIIANNVDESDFQDRIIPDLRGDYISEGVNFIGDQSESVRSGGSGSELTFASTATTIGDLLITTLADNGGTTLTHALFEDSPLVDAGANASLPVGLTADQRGEDRISGGSIDIGAYEFQVPVSISLNGDNPLFVECGIDTFVDPGAVATSLTDGDIADDIVAGGDIVDDTTLGTYTITYNVSDSTGYAAAEITRTAIVRDTTPPTITLTGGNLVLQAGVDTFVEPGFSVDDACDDSVVVLVGGDTVDANTVGTYVISYDATDSSDNVATQRTRTVDVVAPPSYSITADSAVVAEGDSGTTNAGFTVSRTGATDRAGSVDWSIGLAGNLTASDFSGTSGTVNFTAGETSKTLNIAIAGDSIVELDEDFTVTISNPLPSGGLIGTASAQGTIQNDDSAGITISGVTVSEGDAVDTSSLTFTIALDAPVDAPVQVDFATTGGTATVGDDYVATSTTVTVTTDGNTVSVTINPENLAESDETVIATISNIAASGRNVNFTNSEASSTIENDDFAPEAIDDGLYTAFEDSTLAVPVAEGVLANDTDQDDPSSLSVSVITDVQHGTLNLAADGSFTYTPDTDYFGDDEFVYEVSDGTNSAQATARLTVIESIDVEVAIDILQDPIVAGGDAFNVFRVAVINNGPSDATGVELSQTSVFPSGVEITEAVASAGIFNAGVWSLDLAEGASATLTIQAAASASGGVDVIPFAVGLTASDQDDSNSGNNTADAAIDLINSEDAALIISNETAINLQNGLLTGEIEITNNGSAAVPAFRVFVSNLPGDVQLYNASGSALYGDPEAELPYLLYNQRLEAGASISLDVQYFRPSLDLNFSPVYQIELLPFPETELSAAESGIDVERIVMLSNGDVLLEIASIPGRTYVLEYTDNLADGFSRTRQSITAAADRLQVIDSGPPLTETAPGGSRFYRFIDISADR